ncbi:MAG TPA: winged helix DNA-binding domain-containing protein, partial [Micromonosporaceae bacterium]|nr:winged helix DNA-binding domain-containing protein [Micromonosporaceae bacterium]
MTLTLDRRRLNRATLARQFLLARADAAPTDMIRHLVALQGQDPEPPYIGLWNRIDGFRIDDLARLLHDRTVVRGTLFRATQHLSLAEDYRWLRPMLQSMLVGRVRGIFARQTEGLDLDELAAAARELLADRPLTRPELGRALARRWPAYEPAVLGWCAQGRVAVVHPPPDGLWGRRGATPFVLAEQWLGGPLTDAPLAGRLVRRYLAAFGPATAADVRAFSGMAGLREVVEALRPELAVFRDEAGRELFDLPDAPRPDPDVPAPVRFLAPLDNVVLGYADRSRLMSDEARRRVGFEPALTVDGTVRGFWHLRGGALDVELVEPLSRAERDAVTEEGARLLTFAAPDAAADHDIRLTPATSPAPARPAPPPA